MLCLFSKHSALSPTMLPHPATVSPGLGILRGLHPFDLPTPLKGTSSPLPTSFSQHTPTGAKDLEKTMIGTLSSGTRVPGHYALRHVAARAAKPSSSTGLLGQEALPSPGIQQLIPNGHMISLTPKTLDPLPGLSCLSTFWPVPSLQLL